MTINSVTERNDKIRGGKEILAFVDSGAVDNVLPKSVCTEYPLATSTSQSGVGDEGANGSDIKHYGQRRADEDMDEPGDPDGLREEVTDTVGTARVLAAPRTPTKVEREEPFLSLLCHG